MIYCVFYTGMTSDLAKGFANETEATMKVEENEELFHVSSNSKYMPFNIIYKLDEEFDFTIPGLDEPLKAIETCCGNTYTMVQKSSKMTLKMVTKVSPSFMITDYFVVGSSVRAKVVYQRI
jgi:hypothetical protein